LSPIAAMALGGRADEGDPLGLERLDEARPLDRKP
jgi:hypothetical protein